MLTNSGDGFRGKLGFQRFPQAVDNWLYPLGKGEERLWKTLWKMFITVCTWNYRITYVNRTHQKRRKRLNKISRIS